jgi:hypothetical protein
MALSSDRAQPQGVAVGIRSAHRMYNSEA